MKKKGVTKSMEKILFVIIAALIASVFLGALSPTIINSTGTPATAATKPLENASPTAKVFFNLSDLGLGLSAFFITLGLSAVILKKANVF